MIRFFPSIYAIAWIPFFKKFRHQDYPGYEKYVGGADRRKKACSFLFFSGNDPDFNQQILHSEKDFDAFLERKNYRAALALRNITLVQNGDGSLRLLASTADKRKVVGYTPYRNVFFRSKRVWLFSKGVGGIGSELEPDYVVYTDHVFITYKVLFRIGKIGNLVAKILTGHSAPKAKMRVDYEVRRDGTYRVLVTGSFIPNQNWYCNGRDWRHDMLSITEHELKRFMEQDYPSSIAEGNYPPYQIC
jgi:hypothetical protein